MEEKDKTQEQSVSSVEIAQESVLASEKKEQPAKQHGFWAFLDRKDIKFSLKRYGIDALSAMALGLFGSLLIATIFNAIGLIPGLGFFATIGSYGSKAAGPAMAVAIAFALKAPPLVIYSAALVGFVANDMGKAGGPLAVLLIAIIAVEFGKAVSKETKVDILVTPFVTVFVGGGLAILLAPHIGTLVGYIGTFIGWATYQQPFVMGLLVSVVVGMALTLPISSAAICAAIGLSGSAAIAAGLTAEQVQGIALAGGAAVAGCCAQMVGFAVMSFKENRWGGLVSQGLGTSMLQMPNIIKNPRIWIPPTVAAAVTGPLATCVFKLSMYGAAVNAGMGTCGMLGPIGMILGWYGGDHPGTVGFVDFLALALICLILPACISLGLCLLFRRLGWIKENDMKL
ncbi:MAG: PTS sugar transporter subunit IIC [Ruminococcaceae bacterium]|nr:PTS sugar transporter subunit IIC [Oscillospiraceae bacterium]